jgi:hypothetical protein
MKKTTKRILFWQFSKEPKFLITTLIKTLNNEFGQTNFGIILIFSRLKPLIMNLAKPILA